jgi:hypothetical protein
MPGQISAVALYTDFQHAPDPEVVAALETEVDSILSPLGLPLDWRPINGARAREVSLEVAVISFHGNCDPHQGAPVFQPGGLGWTHMSDGQIIPFTDVDCDRIRGFIGGRLSGSDSIRSKLLGRAIGRVVAHELYHILGRRAHHGSEAAGRPEYSVRELLSDRLEASETQCRVLQLVDEQALPPGMLSSREPGGSAKKGRELFAEKHCPACHGERAEGTHRGPPLHATRESISAVLLAAKLGIDSQAMCRRAEHLKIPAFSLSPGDIPDLLRFLNAPPE